MTHILNKVFLIVFLMANILIAEDNYLNIDATFFEADEKQGLLFFKGNVVLTKNNDILKAQRLVINTIPSKNNPKKKIPKDYTATGNVTFTIHTKDNIFNGRGDSVFYNPIDKKYIIIGNGYLEEKKEGKKLSANKIYIDEKTGRTKIDGDKNKPVKFRLRLNDNLEKK